jgi:hypothetical protein
MTRDAAGRFKKTAGDINTAGLNTSPAPTSTVGDPGFAIYGGFVVEHEKDARIVGRQKYTTYSDILANVAIVAAGVRFFLNIISDATWKLEPAREDPDTEPTDEAIEIVKKIEKIRKAMKTPWHRVVRRTAMFRFHGFSVQEWTAKRLDDGTIGYRDIAPRPQITIERWDTDDNGDVVGIIQRSPQTQLDKYLPRHKCIYAVDDTLDDNPAGLGLFRHLVKTATTLARYELLEAWGFERDLRGTPIGRGPLTELEKLVKNGQLTSEQAAALRAPIEKWIKRALKGKETSLFLDSAPYRASGENQQPATNSKQWDIELLSGSGGPHEAIAKAIERLNREMARVLGVEHLLLGSDSSGSFALSKDKTEAFGKMVDASITELVAIFSDDFLGPLFEMNAWDESLMPTFRPDKVQHQDIAKIAQILRDMATAGAPLMPNDPAVNEVRALAGLSHAPEVDEDAALPQPTPSRTVAEKPTGSQPNAPRGPGDPGE